MLQIRSHRTGATETIERDVCHIHPAWVHEQLGTESESQLQQYLDGLDLRTFEENPGCKDAAGMFRQNDEEEIPDDEIIDLSELEQALGDNGLMPGESDGQ